MPCGIYDVSNGWLTKVFRPVVQPSDCNDLQPFEMVRNVAISCLHFELLAVWARCQSSHLSQEWFCTRNCISKNLCAIKEVEWVEAWGRDKWGAQTLSQTHTLSHIFFIDQLLHGSIVSLTSCSGHWTSWKGFGCDFGECCEHWLILYAVGRSNFWIDLMDWWHFCHALLASCVESDFVTTTWSLRMSWSGVKLWRKPYFTPLRPSV